MEKDNENAKKKREKLCLFAKSSNLKENNVKAEEVAGDLLSDVSNELLLRGTIWVIGKFGSDQLRLD